MSAYPYPYPSLFSHAKHRCAECSISCLTTHYKLQLLLSFHVYLSSLQHYHITFSYICVCFLCFVCSRIAFATEVLRGLVSEVTRAPGSGLPFLCCISISSLLSDFSWCGRTLSETPRVSTWWLPGLDQIYQLKLSAIVWVYVWPFFSENWDLFFQLRVCICW